MQRFLHNFVRTFAAFAEEAPAVTSPLELPVETVETQSPAPAVEVPEQTAEPAMAEIDTEAVKQELVDEIVSKLAGPDDENLSVILKPEIVTAPYDPRFPNTNQSRHCFIRYNEYYKCIVERGEEEPRCQFYKRAYEAMCPSEWLEEWQTLRDQGLWTGKY